MRIAHSLNPGVQAIRRAWKNNLLAGRKGEGDWGRVFEVVVAVVVLTVVDGQIVGWVRLGHREGGEASALVAVGEAGSPLRKRRRWPAKTWSTWGER